MLPPARDVAPRHRGQSGCPSQVALGFRSSHVRTITDAAPWGISQRISGGASVITGMDGLGLSRGGSTPEALPRTGELRAQPMRRQACAAHFPVCRGDDAGTWSSIGPSTTDSGNRVSGTAAGGQGPEDGGAGHTMVLPNFARRVVSTSRLEREPHATSFRRTCVAAGKDPGTGDWTPLGEPHTGGSLQYRGLETLKERRFESLALRLGKSEAEKASSTGTGEVTGGVWKVTGCIEDFSRTEGRVSRRGNWRGGCINILSFTGQSLYHMASRAEATMRCSVTDFSSAVFTRVVRMIDRPLRKPCKTVGPQSDEPSARLPFNLITGHPLKTGSPPRVCRLSPTPCPACLAIRPAWSLAAESLMSLKLDASPPGFSFPPAGPTSVCGDVNLLISVINDFRRF
ncbi:hypothetical protein G7046_g6785 [Stylonectria norvegica]|nr:hypothetical protein G7046_g6785 [Stylonectria norvegica]